MKHSSNSPLSPLTNRVLYALLWLLGCLPLWLMRRLGWLAGEVLFCLRTKLYRVAAINIAYCLGELNSQQQRRLLRDFLHNKGMEIAELSAVFTRSPERLRKLICRVHGADEPAGCMAAHQPVVLLNAHFGSFMLAAVCREYTATWLSQDQPGPLGWLIAKRIASISVERVPTSTAGVRELSRQLKMGKAVGMFIDHDPGKSGRVLGQMFGRPAFSSTLTPRLIARHAARAWFYILVRRPNWNYDVHFFPADEGVYAGDPTVAVASINRQLEVIIRQFPAQYDWGYERYRRASQGLYKSAQSDRRAGRHSKPRV